MSFRFTIRLILWAGFICAATDVYAQSSYLEIQYTPDTCFRRTLSFSVRTNLQIEKIILWDFNDPAGGSTSTLSTPSHRYSAPGIYTVSCILEINCAPPPDPNNPISFPCFYTDTVTTNVLVVNCDTTTDHCRLYFPAAFTPNDDARNETFSAVSICQTESYELRIFNKWGQEVFHTTKPYDAWNGQFQGIDCIAGVYAYAVRYTFSSQPAKRLAGYVTLIR